MMAGCTRRMGGGRRMAGGALLLALGALTLAFLEDRPVSSNAASRLASAAAFAECGAWTLDDSPFLWSHDKIFRGGHFYSSKPPAFDWLAAGVIMAAGKCGCAFSAHPVAVYRILIFLLSFLPFMGVVALTWRLAASEPHGWTAPAAAGCASLLWPYATTLTNHPLTALLVLTALALSRRPCRAFGNALLLGCVAASAVLFEVSLGVLWPLMIGFRFSVFGFRSKATPPLSTPQDSDIQKTPGQGEKQSASGLLCSKPKTENRKPKTALKNRQSSIVNRQSILILSYVFGVLAMWGLFLLLNYQRHGSALPAYLHPEWYRYEGSIFAAVDKGPKPYYSVASRLYHITLGHYGVFLMSPLLAFAVWGALARWRKRKDIEPLMVVGCAAALLLGVALNPSAQGHDLGGGSYGLRWFTALYAPLFLYLPAAVALLFGAMRIVDCGLRIEAKQSQSALALPNQEDSISQEEPHSDSDESAFPLLCSIPQSAIRNPQSAAAPLCSNPQSAIRNPQWMLFNWLWRLLFVVSAVFSIAVAFIGVWISPWPHNAISPYPFLDNLCMAALNNTAPPHPIVEAVIRNTSVDLGLSYHDLGTIYLRRGFYEQAVAAFERARGYAPDRIETPFLMAQALERSGRLEPAARILQELLRAEPDHAGALNLLGIILIRGQQPRQALEIYDRLLAKNPNHISALNNSAMILAADGQTTAALDRYDRSLSASPGNFEALYNKALLMEKLGKRGEAAELARQALARRPDHKGCQALAKRLGSD